MYGYGKINVYLLMGEMDVLTFIDVREMSRVETLNIPFGLKIHLWKLNSASGGNLGGYFQAVKEIFFVKSQ